METNITVTLIWREQKKPVKEIPIVLQYTMLNVIMKVASRCVHWATQKKYRQARASTYIQQVQ